MVEVEVVLDHKEFLEYYQPVYDVALSVVHLKGFRPGTAPKDLADKAVDKEKVFQEAVAKTAKDVLREITKENNWQLVDQPKVEVLETNPQVNIGLKMKIAITIFPDVKLGNYQKIAKKVLADKKEVKTTEEELDKTIQWILESRPKTVDEKISELTDEFVKTIGKFQNVAEFKNSVRGGIQKEKEFKEAERMRLKIMEEIVENSDIEMPKIMVEKTLNNLVADYKALVKKSDNESEIRKNLEAKAKNSVATNLVLYEIAKREKLEPTSEEVEVEANQLVKNFPKNQAKDLDARRIYDYSYGVVQNKKVFEFLESLK